MAERRHHHASHEKTLSLREEVHRLRRGQTLLRHLLERRQEGNEGKEEEKGRPKEKDEEKKEPDEQKGKDQDRKLDPRRKILIGAAAAAVVLLGLAWWIYSLRYESTDDAYVEGHISAVAARVAGTITGVYTDENQAVKAGQRLVSLDPRDFQASLAAAQRDMDSAAARIAESEANNAKAQVDVSRYVPLAAKNEVPRVQSDAVVANARALAATVVADKATAAAAAAQRDQAQLNLSYCEIDSPVDGIVAKRLGEVGYHTTPGEQLLLITRLDDLWVTANFRETQLRKLRPGQRARVHVDAIDRTFTGYVESMPAASGAVTSVLPPENATGNFVKIVQRLPVRIRLDKDQPGLDRLRPGMSVEPKVRLD